MSDFIKVNYTTGGIAIIPKKYIHLEIISQEKYSAYSGLWESFSVIWEITLEEYDRLCKELGIE